MPLSLSVWLEAGGGPESTLTHHLVVCVMLATTVFVLGDAN
jgi:hypothetical protein